jgi:hypothetical protein
MKKNIVIGVLVFTTMLFFVFGYMQKIEADKNALKAEQMRVEIEKFRMEAERHRLAADYQTRVAAEAKRDAEKALLELQMAKAKK